MPAAHDSLRVLRGIVTVLAVAGFALSARASAPPGLTLGSDGTVVLGAVPFRGVGVNYYSCFTRTLDRADDRSYDAGFRTLARYHIPFVRFNASGYWPRELDLYRIDRDEYFRRMDGVIRSAEQHGVGLVPSLFWHFATVPDLVGEPCDQWGNRQSRTHAFMREYVRDIVTRYQDSPAIWAWEFGNEYDLAADLPNAAQHRPPVVPNRGTASQRTARDELTYDHLVVAWSEFAREVRRYDGHRLITTGNSILRPTAWHNRQEKTWTKDTPEQFAEMLRLTTPAPINLVSIHCYGADIGRLGESATEAARMRQPLFVGEFQVADSAAGSSRQAFERFLEQLRESRVPLAAVWVFDFPTQEKTYNITADNDRAWQLGVLQEWNRKLKETTAPLGR